MRYFFIFPAFSGCLFCRVKQERRNNDGIWKVTGVVRDGGGENGVEELIVWFTIILVLIFIATGRFRMEFLALSGLLFLGLLGLAPPRTLFSGFGHPALVTIISVFIISKTVTHIGLLRGLGQLISRKVERAQYQILGLAGTAAFLSAFMNNVGAIGLLLPTANRMARRARLNPGSLSLPLTIASILGGSLTIIGTAPNIIISGFLVSAMGKSFRMFDFTPHGLAMILMAFLVWYFCRACGFFPRVEEKEEKKEEEIDLWKEVPFQPLENRDKKITFFLVSVAVVLVAFGLLHPSLAFGSAALLLILSGVLSPSRAYESIDIPIILFLGGMLGLGAVLEFVDGVEPLIGFLERWTAGWGPFGIVLILIFVSTALSNAINNSAAAVFMAPLALGLAGSTGFQVEGLLLAVAAGSNMALILPTHQATLMVLSRAPFPAPALIKVGVPITILAGFAAALVITAIWM